MVHHSDGHSDSSKKTRMPSGRPTGPMKPFTRPYSLSSSSLIRWYSPNACSAFTSFSSWSPGTKHTTGFPSPSTSASALRVADAGIWRNDETSSMVPIPGVEIFSMSPGSPSATVTPAVAASVSAAKPQSSQYTSAASPASASAMNSTDVSPPIWPESATTGSALSPTRSHTFA